MSSRKSSDRFLLVLAGAVFIISSVFTFYVYSNSQKTLVPTRGGTLTEGIVGTPRFVNPVLAITRADQDIVSLVYSGIAKLTPEGTFAPDLAESITISDDGLVYNIVLKESNRFHDDTPVRAEDVAYTIGLVQNPLLKSPLRGNWNDVTVEVISDTELNLVLKEPYNPFIENLTLGILPKHIWNNLTIEQLPFSQHNTDPIGSGPYTLEKVDYNKSGLIDSYTLAAFSQDETKAKISKVILYFYKNEETLINAFKDNAFAATAAFPQSTLDEVDESKYTIETESLPRIFSIFLNQNKSPALRETAVRNALSAAIDRDLLVESALFGYGEVAYSPIPPGFLEPDASSTVPSATTTGDIRYAESLLQNAGWKQQLDRTWVKEIDENQVTLAITLTTSNTEVFQTTATAIRDAWEKLGVVVNVALFDQSDLVQVIIRPRDYEALLFGTEIGRQLDVYPFWHSSQKDDPGLNIAAYTNITTDGLLETARTTQDIAERNKALRTFESVLMKEKPAIFLYSPTFTYVVRNDVTLTPMKAIIRPSERFSQINSWYMSENNVWPIFAN